MTDFFTRAEFLHGVIATLVGFVFAVLWDMWKDCRRRATEQKRARRLVLDEIETNIALLTESRGVLLQDIEFAKQQKEVVAPPAQAPTEAWRTTRLAGSFASTDELAREIGLTYHQLAILNQRLEAREMFRAMNKAMSGYSTSRTKINEGLVDYMGGVLTRLEGHRTALKAAGD